MARTSTFKAGERFRTPPTGLVPKSVEESPEEVEVVDEAASTAPEGTETETETTEDVQTPVDDSEETEEVNEVETEPLDLPTSTNKVGEIDAFAEKHGIEVSGTKNEKLAQIKAWADALPELSAEPAETPEED